MSEPWCTVQFNGDCFVAYDGRWYGYSARPAAAYTERSHRRLVQSALEALTIEPVRFGGPMVRP